MKLDKAIETLTDILRFVKPGDPPEEHDALKLGVEALKRVEDERGDPGNTLYVPLLGETPSDR